MKYCEKVNIETLISENQPGLYAWTFDDYSGTAHNKKYRVKIGIGQDVCKRLYSYHTAHPDGVWILALGKVKDKTHLRELETKLKKILSLKGLFYKSERYYMSGRSGERGEWFHTTVKQICIAFDELYSKNKRKFLEPPKTGREIHAG